MISNAVLLRYCRTSLDMGSLLVSGVKSVWWD